MYDQAVAVVLQHRRASISLVQRHLRIGYNRAARLLEQMEKSGVVSAMQTNGNREILVPAGKAEADDRRPERRRGPQQAQPFGAHLQDVAGEDRHQRRSR